MLITRKIACISFKLSLSASSFYNIRGAHFQVALCLSFMFMLMCMVITHVPIELISVLV